jgi:hypothetical protein
MGKGNGFDAKGAPFAMFRDGLWGEDCGQGKNDGVPKDAIVGPGAGEAKRT